MDDDAHCLDAGWRSSAMLRKMLIREERRSDHAAIADVTTQAFAGAEHGNRSEPEIIARLRATGTLTLSLVVVDGDAVVGHAAFSPVTIETAQCGWFGLGPVSVRPDRQGEGIGGALIRQGLDQLRLRGAAGCVVLGNPAYYCRFGFERDAGLRYEGAPPAYFMRRNLGVGETPTGRVDYAPAFSG